MNNASQLATEYQMAMNGAVFFDRSQVGKITATGPEAGKFLHNMASNDVLSLKPGECRELFFATAKAKVVAHAHVHRRQVSGDDDCYWLEVAPGVQAKLFNHLNHYLISEQVEFVDLSGEFVQFLVTGTNAEQFLERAPDSIVGKLMSRAGTDPGNHVRSSDALGIPGFDILCRKEEGNAVWSALAGLGVNEAGMDLYDTLRIEAGIPEQERDFDENYLIMELGRTAQAISYSKGCYLGQEPVVRSRDIGHVNRSLIGVKFASADPVPFVAKLKRNGEEVGQLATAAYSPRLGATIALAFIRRGHQEPGTQVELVTAGASRFAIVTTLPFVPT